MRLRAHHWLFAFALALFAHLLLFLSQQEALLEPPKLQFRGGGLFDEGGDSPDSGGVLVTLGRLGETPGDAPQEVATSPQPPEEPAPPELSQPEAAAVPEPEPTPEPEPEPEPEVTEEAPVEPASEPEAPTEIAALPEPTPEPEPVEEVPPPPIPLRKPEPPRPEPQLEVVERRLPVQAPAETAPAEPQPPAEPDTAQAPSEPLVAAELPIVPGRIGDASGNETGLVPRLNYEQRVLLWLKRNGNYPRDSYRYNQEGVVLLEFTIDRSGRILSYDILESSGYHLLDRAVHEMMARASPVPPMPESIPEQQMRFKVPVRFERG